VLLSHLHGDHFDRVARHGLDHGTPLLTTRHAARKLARRGFTDTRGLGFWDTDELISADGGQLRVTAVPAHHAKGPMREVLPDTNGTVLEFSPSDGSPRLTMYITGDTLVHEELREIGRHFPQLDVGLWHLGATRVLGILVTMDGNAGADLLELVRPRVVMPIHYDDYGVFTEGLTPFLQATRSRGMDGIKPIPRGEPVSLLDQLRSAEHR
jgi:L-ascorbate metabolism protein UlaG (beta-lactamase superfamily)